MEVDFSRFKSNDLTTTSTSLLQIILDNIQTGIEVLRAVRKDNIVVDFEYILVNEVTKKRAGTKLLGKRYLNAGEDDPHFFSRMIEVTETGHPFQVIVNTKAYGSPRWFAHKYVKFEDGVIISKEDITEKKLSEQSAIDLQDFIENIANSTPDIIYVLDLETRTFIYMNTRGYDILGLTEKGLQEAGHDIFFQVIHPDDYVRRMDHYTTIGNDATEHVHEIDVRKKVKDGSYRWFRVRDKVYRRDNHGRALSIIGIATDIDEEKQATMELQNREKEFRALLNNTPDIIIRWNKQLRILYANDSIVALTGASPETIAGAKSSDRKLFGELAGPWTKAIKTVFETGNAAEQSDTIHGKQGPRYLYSQLVPEKNADGETVTVLLIAKDVTDLRKTEEQFREKSDRLSRVQETVPDMISVTNMLTREFDFLNGEIFRRHGFDPEKMKAWTPMDHFERIHTDDRVALFNYFQSLVKAGDEDEITVEYRAKDDQGVVKWFLARGRVFERNTEGIPTHVLNVISDITERKLREIETLRSKEMIAQKANARRESQLAHIQRIGGVASVDIEINDDIETTTTYPSSEYRVLHGLRPEEERESYDSWTNRIHPDDRGKAIAILKHAIQTGAVSYESEYRIIRPIDQQIRWIAAKIDIERNEDGKAVRLVGAHIDFTRIKEAEEAIRIAEHRYRIELETEVEQRVKELQESKALLQSVFDSTTNGLSVLEAVRDGKGKITDFRYQYINRAGASINGRDDLVGALYSKMHKGFKATGLFDMLIDVVEKGEPGHHELYYDEEGFKNWFSVSASRLQDGVVMAFEDITQRKNIELNSRQAQLATLQQNASLANFKRIIDTSHDGIISMDHEGRVDYWNAAAEHIYGYTRDEVLGKKLEELIVIQSLKADHRKTMDRVYAMGEPALDIEIKHRKKDGGLVDAYISLFPLRDEKGGITGSCLVTRDITEVRYSKQKIREDAHLIGQIMDTTPDIVYIMDLNTYQVIYTNRQVAIELGYEKHQVAQMKNPIFDIMHPDDVPAMIEHFKKIKTLATDDRILEIEYRLRKPSGAYDWFCDRNSVFKRNSRQVPQEKLGFCQNITDRKQKEELARTRLTILHQAEQVVNMGSWEYDIINDQYKWSDGMYRLFDLNKNIPVRPEIYLHYGIAPEKPLIEVMVKNILQHFSAFEETITITSAGGEQKIIKTKAVVENDKSGAPLKILGVDIDVTQQLTASREINTLYRTLLKKNRELEVLDSEIRTFNRISAHQYKETLQQLYTNLEYIVSKDGRALSDTSKANIRRAQSAIQKMNLLTDDINAYFKLFDVEAEISEIDTNTVVKHVIARFQQKLEEANAKVEYTELPRIPSNASLFAQLMGHLLDNALKFRATATAPVIRFNYSRVDELNEIPSAIKDTPYVIISITDNGIGFNEDVAEKIFEIFYRLSETGQNRGRGMGLAICRKIMALHDGFITADGATNKGATFNCYFPLRPIKA
jgi:PAS domain S-box-containing protein